MSNQILKAVRVEIKLGCISLNVYQLPDGSYRLAGRNVTDAIGEANNTLPRHFGVKSIKDLPSSQNGTLALGQNKDSKTPKPLSCNDLSLKQIKANTGETFVPVSIGDAVAYWGAMAQKGNQKAIAILTACAIEAIERRADHALGISRTEEFRNAAMQARIDGILQRHFWTDCIKEYLDTHDVSTEYQSYIYARVSDYLNQRFFGMSAKEIRLAYGIPKKDLLRDHVMPEYLPDITFIEKHAGYQVKRGVDPLEAIQEAVEFVGIRTRQFRTTTSISA